ncbi:MAG: hypothetical protein P0120_14605 [Nitrospira sp.]|nr:hypothetical protein [Nitrospira sp.]
MAVAYKKDELLSASKVARCFGEVLADLSEKRRRRVAVVKNNHLDTILLPVEEYETMAEALSLLEHLEIYRRNNALRYSVTLPADAADDFRRLDGSLKQPVAKQLKKIETSPPPW